MPNGRRLAKSRNKVIAGVCGGIAEFLGWPPPRVRGLWGIGTVLTGFGPGVIVYVILALAMPPPTSFNLDDYRQQ